MFLSKENVILESNKKYVQVGNLIDELEYKSIDICALKTALLPTIKLSQGASVLTPCIYEKGGKHFLKNDFKPVMSLQEGDFIYIPKLEILENHNVPRNIAWLYGKYIASGYIKSSGKFEQIIIPIKTMSSREEAMIMGLDSTVAVKSKEGKIIVCSNMKIIEMFKNFTRAKSLKPFILESSPSIYKLFLRSLLLEKDEAGRVKIENIVLAHELFLYTYSKLNKILRIMEEHLGSKRKRKSSTKKSYYMYIAKEDEYKIIGNNLYIKIIQNRYGRNTLGIDISQNRLYKDTTLICNSIVLQNDSSSTDVVPLLE